MANSSMMRITGEVLTWLLWLVIIALSIYFFLDDVVAYFFGYRSRIFGDTFFHNQFWVVMHMAGGTALLFLGPLQFWKYFRNKFLRLHRLLGKVYLIGAALAGLSALRLAVISTCVPCRISLLLLAIFLLLSSGLAWRAILNRNVKAHQHFMIRSYVCALAFVLVRLEVIVPLDFLFGTIDDATLRRTVNEYFFSFVPLLITEIFITWLPQVTGNKKSKPVEQ
jgi:uncharacterized membrane protein